MLIIGGCVLVGLIFVCLFMDETNFWEKVKLLVLTFVVSAFAGTAVALVTQRIFCKSFEQYRLSEPDLIIELVEVKGTKIFVATDGRNWYYCIRDIINSIKVSEITSVQVSTAMVNSGSNRGSLRIFSYRYKSPWTRLVFMSQRSFLQEFIFSIPEGGLGRGKIVVSSFPDFIPE